MAKAATTKAKTTRARKTAPKAVAAESASAREALQAFLDANGAAADLPPAEAFAPGATLSLQVSAPQSIERFVADARANPLVKDVQVLATHVALTVSVPLEA